MSYTQPPPSTPQGPNGQQGNYSPYGPIGQATAAPRKGKGCLIAAGVVVGIFLLIGIVIVVLVGGAAEKVAEGQPEATTGSTRTRVSEEPSEPASADPQGDEAKVGEPFPYEGRNGSGSVTVLSAKWTKKGLVNPKSGSYLILDIKVAGSKGEINYNPLYFKVKDEDGREYNLAFGADAEPSLKSGALKRGDKARGYVAFDVKKGDIKLTITDELLQDAASINIPG